MDSERYTAGFNIGYMLGETNGNEDLIQRMNTICAQNQSLSFSKGFHHGFQEGRSKIRLEKRKSSLAQILRDKRTQTKSKER